jgi:hypothetical protein
VAQDDDKDQMLGRALSYLVLYSTLGMILRWSWGMKLLSVSDKEEGEGQRKGSEDNNSSDDDNIDDRDEDDNAPLIDHHDDLSGRSSPSLGKRRSAEGSSDTEPSTPVTPGQSGNTTPLEPNLFTSSESNLRKKSNPKYLEAPNGKRRGGGGGGPNDETDDDDGEGEDEEWGLPLGAGRRSGSGPGPWRRRWNKVWRPITKFLIAFSNFMTVPL